MYGFGLLLLAPLLSRLRLVAAAANCSQAAYRACNDIADSVPDDRVTFPLDLSYETEQDSYWSLALRDLRAACIVFPETPEEAAAAIEVLAEYPGVPFTAKSGGHDPNVGHATAKGGVVISMARLTGTTYDADTGLAYVRPGGEWNDVIATLEEDGVTLVGGRLGQ
jgi:FAD/FMN-containing dehydrogenase